MHHYLTAATHECIHSGKAKVNLEIRNHLYNGATLHSIRQEDARTVIV